VEYIYAFTHQAGQLTDFITSFNFSGNDFMLLESITDIRFDFYTNTDFHTWSQGRVFNTEEEVRWRKTGNEFKTVIITHDSSLTGYTRKEEIPFKPEELDIYLWGIEAASKSTPSFPFEENHYIETIIPRVLAYPVKAKKDCRVLLTIVHYLDEYGNPKYFRFKGVKTDG
jgi:beta-glucanase (GH16 family)